MVAVTKYPNQENIQQSKNLENVKITSSFYLPNFYYISKLEIKDEEYRINLLKNLGLDNYPNFKTLNEITPVLIKLQNKHFEDYSKLNILEKENYGLLYVKKVAALIKLMPKDNLHNLYIEKRQSKLDKQDFEYFLCKDYLDSNNNVVKNHFIQLTKSVSGTLNSWNIKDNFILDK